MPSFSGLWDGVHTDPYFTSIDGGSGTPPSSVPTPALGGMARVMMQKRGMWGFVGALGRNTYATRKQVQTDRSDLTVRGGYDYANREDDAANQVTIPNMGDDVNTLEDADRVSNVSAATLVATFDTTKNHGYVGDSALNGVTAVPLTERVAT